MSAVLWTDEEDGIDLGPSMALLAVFKELAQTAKEEYPALYGVPHAVNGDPVDEAWLAKVAKQAQKYVAKYGSEVSLHARWVLQQLELQADQPEAAADSG